MNTHRVKIENVKDSTKKWQAEFESLAKAEAWLEDQKKLTNRLPERQKPTSQCSEEELTDATSTIPAVTEEQEYFEVIEPAVFDEAGNVITEAVLADQPSTRTVELEPEYKVLPPQATYVIEDITAESQLKNSIEQKIKLGKNVRKLSQDVLALIAGWNLDRNLTVEQITEIETTFTDIQKLLMSERPFSAKPLIDAITPDGTLVTQEMIDQVNHLYQESGLGI